jgi:hypothetical protein
VVVALGGGTALASPALMGSVSHRLGDSVAASASACSQSTGSAHGACVSAAAEKKTDTSSGGSGDQSRGDSKSSGSSADAHGDAVSAAARSCAHGTASDRDAHGDCVSAVARSNASHTGGH